MSRVTAPSGAIAFLHPLGWNLFADQFPRSWREGRLPTW